MRFLAGVPGSFACEDLASLPSGSGPGHSVGSCIMQVDLKMHLLGFGLEAAAEGIIKLCFVAGLDHFHPELWQLVAAIPSPVLAAIEYSEQPAAGLQHCFSSPSPASAETTDNPVVTVCARNFNFAYTAYTLLLPGYTVTNQKTEKPPLPAALS